MIASLDPLALYGAGMSTVLFALRIVEELRRRRTPAIQTEIFPVRIHYEDGVLEDTAIRIVIENRSSLSRNIDDCTVLFFANPQDPSAGRQAQLRDEEATYPINVGPYSTVHLYSYLRHLIPVYKQTFGGDCADEKKVALRAKFSGRVSPVIITFGSFSPEKGLKHL